MQSCLVDSLSSFSGYRAAAMKDVFIARLFCGNIRLFCGKTELLFRYKLPHRSRRHRFSYIRLFCGDTRLYLREHGFLLRIHRAVSWMYMAAAMKTSLLILIWDIHTAFWRRYTALFREYMARSWTYRIFAWIDIFAAMKTCLLILIWGMHTAF